MLRILPGMVTRKPDHQSFETHRKCDAPQDEVGASENDPHGEETQNVASNHEAELFGG
jgi:hypothetical protein